MSLTIAPVKCEEKRDEQQHKSAWFQFMKVKNPGPFDLLNRHQLTFVFVFLKSVATFRGDLTSLTAPPFLLAPRSIVEYSTYWSEHPRLLVSPAKEECPKRRALLVLQWFLSTLKHQHASRDENGKRKKMKPLNPFLGEIFLGKWVDDAGTTHLITEQVSHHPPATAYRIWNDAHGVRVRSLQSRVKYLLADILLTSN